MNYGEKRNCFHCGRPVVWIYGGTSGCDMWIHEDDTYFCDETRFTSAEGRTEGEVLFNRLFPISQTVGGVEVYAPSRALKLSAEFKSWFIEKINCSTSNK